ncbi:hypothetical protein COCVIDRAFT_83805 [Bipolaris victoriae FI3]|uniref:ADP-ribose 1''-phosphate phosphatase n=1 Tax=Bipolaris victoriae (strain FI3) TaxID=930091 RepID=W7EYA1_BIPV3|nr:hypothetical protein COCVIDRAFT_83805 [Bipolaris victoriae FI3]
MSDIKNASITSYFKPKTADRDQANSQKLPKHEPENQPVSGTPTPQDTSKNKTKRSLSTSSALLPSKRQDTKTTPTLTPLSYKDLPPSPPSTTSSTLSLTHHTGSLFTAPPGTLLLHACNTQGSWGSGIALAFKKQYPNAYTIYHAFCTKEHSPKTGNSVPVGTTLLIPPVDGDKGHWIGCLFTSRRYGKGKDAAGEILRNTGRAIEGCLGLLGLLGEEVASVRMCRINSGKFGVPWERTEVLRGVVVREGWVGRLEVWNTEGS